MSNGIPKTKQAMDALMALTPHERGLVLCWFCRACHAYVGPGDEGHRCPEQDADAVDQEKREHEVAHNVAVKMLKELAEAIDVSYYTTWPQLLRLVKLFKEDARKFAALVAHDAPHEE